MATPPQVTSGYESTYHGNMVLVRQLDEYLLLLEDTSFPLLQAVGLDSYPFEVSNVKVEWQQAYALPNQDALADAISSTTATEITVAHAEYFVPYDVILIDSELMRVSVANDSAGTLTVERGFADTTKATHSNSTTIYKLGTALPEASAPGVARQVGFAQQYNYTQIWDGLVAITGTEKAMEGYGPDDLLAWRLDQVMMGLYQQMERSLLYGVRYQPTTNTGRSSGGLVYFIHDQNNLSGLALTESAIRTALSDVFSRTGSGFMPKDAWSNTWAKQVVSQMFTGYAVQDAARTVGGIVIDVIHTDFGDIRFHVDHLIRSNELFLLNMDYIFAKPLRGRALAEYDASTPGVDAEMRRVLGEYVWIVQGEDGTNDGPHVRIYGFSTSA